MITIPQLDAVSNILDTDVIIVAHANGIEAFRLTGANLKAAIRANRCDLYNNNNLNVSDCNNLPEGFYSARGLDNRPSAVSSGSWAVYFTQLLNNNPLYKKQICIHGANATISLRGCNNGTWSDWNVVGLPVMPASDGNYNLQCSVASGVPTYSWENGIKSAYYKIDFTETSNQIAANSYKSFALSNWGFDSTKWRNVISAVIYNSSSGGSNGLICSMNGSVGVYIYNTLSAAKNTGYIEVVITWFDYGSANRSPTESNTRGSGDDSEPGEQR